jgi:hypothetical protein
MTIRKEKMYECCKSTVVLILLILTIPVSVCRPLTGEKAGVVSKYGTQGFPHRAPLPPSGPSPCTYIPGNGQGGHSNTGELPDHYALVQL